MTVNHSFTNKFHTYKQENNYLPNGTQLGLHCIDQVDSNYHLHHSKWEWNHWWYKFIVIQHQAAPNDICTKIEQSNKKRCEMHVSVDSICFCTNTTKKWNTFSITGNLCSTPHWKTFIFILILHYHHTKLWFMTKIFTFIWDH